MLNLELCSSFKLLDLLLKDRLTCFPLPSGQRFVLMNQSESPSEMTALARCVIKLKHLSLTSAMKLANLLVPMFSFLPRHLILTRYLTLLFFWYCTEL